MQAKAPGNIIGDVGDVTLFETLADTLEVADAKALGVTLRDVMVEKLVDKLANAR